MAFVFNKDYDDKSQVEPFMDAYTTIRDELDAAGKYPYDAEFEGRIPAIAGPNEKTAIYLMQSVHRIRQEQRRIQELRDSGYLEVTTLAARTRFEHIVVYQPGYYSGGTGLISEYRDARLVPDASGKPHAILPKGKRTNGYQASSGLVLVKAAA